MAAPQRSQESELMERNPLIVIASRTGAEGVVPSTASGPPQVMRSWRRAVDAGLGCVIVDSPDPEIAAAIGAVGGYVYDGGRDMPGEVNYVTPSGAERLAATVNKFDRFYNHDVIINLPEDRGDIDRAIIRALMYPLADLGVDIATLVEPISAEDAADEADIKVDIVWQERRRVHVLADSRVGQARDFSRKPATIGGPPFYRHVPIYAYKRASLDRFIRAEPCLRELEERLEPARALELGMRIDVVMLGGAGRAGSVPNF